MVTTRYSNQPRKRETYRRKDNVFGYELQFLESEVCKYFTKEVTIYRENCLMCCVSNKVFKRDSKRFFLLLEVNRKASYAILNKKWFRPISKRFIKSPYSISRATSADSDCYFIPTAIVLSSKADTSHSNQV